jgi:hypothetical protein
MIGDDDLRDCFAMFALAGLLIRGNNKLIEIPEGAYEMADAMMEARNAKPEIGIKTVRKARNNAKNNINS